MITYQVDMQDLTEIEAAFGMAKDKSRLVLRNAVNDTAKDTKALLVDEAAEEYVLKRSVFKKNIDVNKAKVSSLTAVVSSVGKVNDLYNFRVVPKRYAPHNRPAHHKVKVKTYSQLTPLMLKPEAPRDKYKAFVVKFKSGHIAVAQRVPGKYMKPKRTKTGKISSAKREAIKTLYSSSIPNMLGYEKGVYGIVEPQIHDLLVKHIQTQMLKFLK